MPRRFNRRYCRYIIFPFQTSPLFTTSLPIDFVRLHEKLDPPHWKKGPGEKWDDGYEKTAYFLDWIEDRYGDGTIRELNESLRDSTYHLRIFESITGRPLPKLWTMYCMSFKGDEANDSQLVDDNPSTEIKLDIVNQI